MREPGIDLMQWRPDPAKTNEENMESWRQEYKRVYGEEPPGPMSQEELDKRLKSA